MKWFSAPVAGLVLGGLSLMGAGSPPPVQGTPKLGFPVPGLSRQEDLLFWAAAGVFGFNVGVQKGLGPVFNGTSCRECHGVGAPGGAGASSASDVFVIGGIRDGEYSDLADLGGPILQQKSLDRKIKNYPVHGEKVPAEALFVSRRTSPQLFGLGLIEAIDDQTLLDLAARPEKDGVKGRVNWVLNPLSQEQEIGRFGWKAQISDLEWFASFAYLNEIGVTNPLMQEEIKPSGKPIPPGADLVQDPEDIGADIDAFYRFMSFLAPPPPLPSLDQAGKRLFETIGCGRCHVPSLTTKPDAHPALASKVIAPYSDFLLHDMGPGLADGIRQGDSSGSEFRTAPLWGVRLKKRFLHDGRAKSFDAAIRAHGGEATVSRDRYQSLKGPERKQVQRFLAGL